VTELHQHLAGLAEEVVVVDLRDRVRQSSRRATTRRRILTVSASAAAVMAIAAGVAWAGVPRAADHTVVPVTSASPTGPSPTGPAPTEPSPSGPAPSTPPASTVLTGTMPTQFFYLRDDRRLVGAASFTAPAGTCGLSLSPDHTKVAYVTNRAGTFHGDLIVADLRGGSKVTVADDVLCSGGMHPQWLSPRQLLIYHSDDFPGRRTMVDVRSGRPGSTPLDKVEDYVAASPNGEFVAYRRTGDRLVVARPNGKVVHTVPIGDVLHNGNGFAVLAVSDDGRRVAVGAMNTDPDVARTGTVVINTENGRQVELPGRSYDREVLLPAGPNMVVRVSGRLHLVAPDGTILDRRAEPDSLRNAQLIAAS
jgi:hypothetical protein